MKFFANFIEVLSFELLSTKEVIYSIKAAFEGEGLSREKGGILYRGSLIFLHNLYTYFDGYFIWVKSVFVLYRTLGIINFMNCLKIYTNLKEQIR